MRVPIGSTKRLVQDYGFAVLFAILVALLIRSFLFEAYRIPTHAMRPTLEAGDTIFASKWKYWLGSKLPERGEVVIFSSEKDLRTEFIKRVIGLPGETVEMHSGKIRINGKPLEIIREKPPCGIEILSPEKRYGACWETPFLENFAATKIPSDSVFVIGDFRGEILNGATADVKKIKSWGIIPLSSIKASAKWIWLSIEPKKFDTKSFDKGTHTRLFPRFRFERMFRRIP